MTMGVNGGLSMRNRLMILDVRMRILFILLTCMLSVSYGQKISILNPTDLVPIPGLQDDDTDVRLWIFY